jgi:hypothetical protein
MLKLGDINTSFLEVFNSMEEKVEYKLNDQAFQQLNQIRINKGYPEIKPFIFYRTNDALSFNWKENGWASTLVTIEKDSSFNNFAFAFSFTFSFALSFALSLAFAQYFTEGQIVSIDESPLIKKEAELSIDYSLVLD